VRRIGRHRDPHGRRDALASARRMRTGRPSPDHGDARGRQARPHEAAPIEGGRCPRIGVIGDGALGRALLCERQPSGFDAGADTPPPGRRSHDRRDRRRDRSSARDGGGRTKHAEADQSPDPIHGRRTDAIPSTIETITKRTPIPSSSTVLSLEPKARIAKLFSHSACIDRHATHGQDGRRGAPDHTRMS